MTSSLLELLIAAKNEGRQQNQYDPEMKTIPKLKPISKLKMASKIKTTADGGVLYFLSYYCLPSTPYLVEL